MGKQALETAIDCHISVLSVEEERNRTENPLRNLCALATDAKHAGLTDLVPRSSKTTDHAKALFKNLLSFMPNICHYVGGLEDDLLNIGELAKNELKVKRFSLAFQPGYIKSSRRGQESMEKATLFSDCMMVLDIISVGLIPLNHKLN